MIGKIMKGKSFGGCLAYCLNDKQQKAGEEPVMKNRAEIILFNQCGGDQTDLIKQFNEVRQLNKKIPKAVLHVTLSLALGEQLPKDKWMSICEDCAKELGFEKNQYVAVLHKDTNHQHVHIVANRIGFDGRMVSDSRDYQKMATFCRKTELKYGLKQIQSPRQFLSKSDQWQPRENERLNRLEAHIRQTLKEVTTYGEFEQKMKSLGYAVLKGRGIAFIDDKKVKIKGSEVGFSLMKIEKILALKEQIRMDGRQQSEKRESMASSQSQVTTKGTWPTNQGLGLAKDAQELLRVLTEPTPTYEELEPEWVRRKKKQRRGLRH
jgi:DNA-binding transcriptional MerR regulator